MENEKKDEFSYKRENGEDIVEKKAIQSCKDEQNRDIIENKRLGSYDKYGNYIVIPEITNELISIPKLIYNTREEDRDKIYDLKSELPIFGAFFFKLKISKVEAVLYLVETVSREAGEYVEVYEEVVDTLSLAEEKIPEKIIFRNFNIYETEDDFGKEYEEFFNFENILLRKMYLSLLSSKLQEKTKGEEKEYFKQMYEFLQNGGEYGKRVINEFMKRLRDRKEIFDTQDEATYNRATSEILLSAIEMVTTEKDLQDENTKKIYLEVINVRNKNIEKYIQDAQKEVDEKYIRETINNATRAHLEKNEEKQNEVKLQFEDKLSKQVAKGKKGEKKTLDKPLMKQLTAKQQKEKILEEALKQGIIKDETKTKEEKVKVLVEKKQEIKKQEQPVKKVTPSKAQKKGGATKSSSKSASKKPSGGAKKPSKPQVKKPAKAKPSSSQKAGKATPFMTKSKGGASKSKSSGGGGGKKPANTKKEVKPDYGALLKEVQKRETNSSFSTPSSSLNNAVTSTSKSVTRASILKEQEEKKITTEKITRVDNITKPSIKTTTAESVEKSETRESFFPRLDGVGVKVTRIVTKNKDLNNENSFETPKEDKVDEREQ